jgi:ABC-type lipoprotein export system ATPase subunit
METDKPQRKIILSANNLSRFYRVGKNKVDALQDVSLSVYEGEFVAVVGTSGSGKSTLLSLIGGLEKPSYGEIAIDGIELKKMSDAELSRYRGRKLGFVFQSYYLQPFLTVEANIEVPAVFAGVNSSIRQKRVRAVAEAVGITDRLKHLPKELSGGQIQRVAIARALVNQPKLLLADEPTGNLDSTNAIAIFDLFEKVRRELGTTVVVVTHDENLASRSDRIIRLVDGRLTS